MKKKLIYTLLCIVIIACCNLKNIANSTILSKEVTEDRKKMSMINTEDFFKKIESLNGNTATTLIIGSGPAAQAAAMYCARLGGRPLVIAGNDGGQLEYTGVVENIPYVINKQGKDVVALGIQQAKSFGAHFVNEVVTKILVDEYPFKVITNKNVYYAFSIILAMGSNIKKLECPGADLYWGKGISSCAVCDAPLYKDKKVIVVGGGDGACESALQLAFYAKEIAVFVRKSEMRASKIMQEKIKDHKKIKVFYNTEIQKINGDSEKVTHVTAFSDQEKQDFPVDGLFIAIGQFPNTQLVEKIVNIDPLTKAIEYRGRSQATSFDGIFGAGEVGDTHYKQAGIATGEGIKAALDAFDFLTKQSINDEFIKKYMKIWFVEEKICPNGICSIEDGTKIVREEVKKGKISDISYNRDFKKIINKNKMSYFLVDFTAPWCSGCKVLKKTLHEYIKEGGELDVFTINVDEMNSEVVTLVKPNVYIKSIPLLLLMKGDAIVARHIGSMDLKELKSWIQKNKRN